MIQVPLLLPARLQGSYAQRSPAGLLWRAIDGLSFLSGQTPTYSRAGNAYSFDSKGRLLKLVHSAPNIVMVDAATAGGTNRNRPAILVSNIVGYNGIHFSEDITQPGTWAQTNSPSFGANSIVHGNLTLRELRDTSGATQARLTQALPALRFGSGNAHAHQFTFFVAYPATSAPATSGGSVILQDTTAGAERLKIRLPFSGTTPNFSASSGTLQTVEYVGTYRSNWYAASKDIYRVHALTTSAFDPDNAHELRVHAADTASEQGSLFIGGFYADSLSTCVGYVQTLSGAADTRGADNWTLPWNALPREMTIFLDFVTFGQGGDSGYPIFIGDSGAGIPYFGLYLNAGVYQAVHHNGSALVSASVSGTANPMQRVRLRAVLKPDGSVYAGMRIQNGAEVVGSASGPNTLPSTWGATPKLEIRGPCLLLGAAALFGERTMTFCETLVG